MSQNEILSNKKRRDKHNNLVFIMLCAYLFLYVVRPWETISYLHGFQIERWYAIVMIFVYIFSSKAKLEIVPSLFWIICILLIHFLFAPFSYIPESSINQGLEYAKLVIIYIVMIGVVKNEIQLICILRTYLYSTILYALHSLLEYSNGRVEYRMGISRMVGSDFSDPNSFGASLVLSLPIAYILMTFENNKFIKNVIRLYYILVIYCVVLTGSRSAFLGLLFLCIIWFIFQKKNKIITFIIIIFSLFALWNFMPIEKRERIQTLWDENAGPENAHTSAQGRIDGLIMSWDIFLERPLTGVGAGGDNFMKYPLANRNDNKIIYRGQPHNLYGQVISSFGIIGVILFVGYIISIYKSCNVTNYAISSYNFLYLTGVSLRICLVLLLFFGLAGHNFYRPLWVWIGAWSGIIFSINKKQA